MSIATPVRAEPVPPRDEPAASSRLRARAAGLAILLLIVAGGIWRSRTGTRLDGFTYDEPWHIVAGADYVRTGDFSLNPEHPPLVKLAAGAALPATFRLPPRAPLVEKAQERELVEEVMFLQNGGLSVQPRVRAALWGLHATLLLGLALLLWRAFGWVWAAGTTTFLAIDPTVAAFMPVAMTDLSVGVTLAGAAVAAGVLAVRWQWRWVAVTGFAMGLALCSKHSALPGLAGIALVLAIFAVASFRGSGLRAVAGRVGRVAAAGLIALAVLWAAYGFRFHAGLDGRDDFNREITAKISDVQTAHWRVALRVADAARLFPRAYTWGLADTIRAGIEGRGQGLHTLWGRRHQGRPPLHTWPSYIVIKLPLASLALVMLGFLMLLRTRLDPAARRALWILAGMSGVYLLALMTSQASYAGVRHAFPLVIAVAIVAGAVLSIAYHRRARVLMAAGAILFVASLAMTIGEPRALGYHNELAGGTDDAYRYFANEGLGMGQRFPEIRDFYERTVRPTGLPIYLNYWLIEEELQAAKINFQKRVESLHDSNTAGVYDGYFVYHIANTLEWPGMDPAETFRGLTMVARFGDAGIWRGRQVLPRARASAMYATVTEYLYEEDGREWDLVAARLEEVVQQIPNHVGAGVELGNAYLRLGARESAVRSYQGLLDQKVLPVDDLVRRQLTSQIAMIRVRPDIRNVPPMRNPWLE